MLLSKFPNFYYGWVVVAVAIIAGAFTAGISVWCAGTFLIPMTEAFSWTRTEYSLGLAIRALSTAFVAPWIGPWFDKPNGPRTLMTISVSAMGLSMIGMGFIGDLFSFGILSPLAQYYLLYGVVGGAAQMGAGMGLTQTVLPKWFIKKRGRVLGIAATGSALAPLIFPPMVQFFSDEFGFRHTWVILGISLMVILVPLSRLVKTQPEDIGLLPDNNDPTTEEETSNSKVNIDDGVYTRSMAVRTKAFWLLAASFAFISLGMAGYQVNWQPYFIDVGFSASTAAYAVSFYAIFSIASRLIWGFLGDQFHPRKLLVIGLLLICSCVIFLQTVDSMTELIIFGIFQGLSIGSFIILEPLLVARYFGRQNLGAIFGLMRPAMTLLGASSPLVVAALYDFQGTYVLAFAVVAMSWFLAAILVGIAKEPKHKTDTL